MRLFDQNATSRRASTQMLSAWWNKAPGLVFKLGSLQINQIKVAPQRSHRQLIRFALANDILRLSQDSTGTVLATKRLQ